MVTRLDLDGTYSPGGLVTKILKAEPNLKVPVPVEEIAYQLEISEIATLTTDGFEGGLLTDENRTFGAILVKEGVSRQRRRFTIGHELGHFLNIYHKPADADQFLCDRAAMRHWDVKAQQKAQKMEAEANRFSALLLMPPPMLRPIIDAKRYPSLKTVLEIHEHFDVSKEAAARSYAEYNPELIAVLITRYGKYLRSYRKKDFPWINLAKGDPVPETSRVHSMSTPGEMSDSTPTETEYWIETNYGEPIPRMYEQVLMQSNGYAMIQLKLLKRDELEFDPDEDLSSKQRFQRQQERWNR